MPSSSRSSLASAAGSPLSFCGAALAQRVKPFSVASTRSLATAITLAVGRWHPCDPAHFGIVADGGPAASDRFPAVVALRSVCVFCCSVDSPPCPYLGASPALGGPVGPPGDRPGLPGRPDGPL